MSLSIAFVLIGPVVVVLSVVFLTVLDIATITGTSMEPTLRQGDFVIALRRLRFVPIRRGCIVFVRPDRPGSRVWIKRVVATSGEDYVTRLSEFSSLSLRQAYRGRFDPSGQQVVHVPLECVFIRGDSPGPIDSAFVGAIPVGRILAIVFIKLAPR